MKKIQKLPLQNIMLCFTLKSTSLYSHLFPDFIRACGREIPSNQSEIPKIGLSQLSFILPGSDSVSHTPEKTPLPLSENTLTLLLLVASFKNRRHLILSCPTVHLRYERQLCHETIHIRGQSPWEGSGKIIRKDIGFFFARDCLQESQV